MPSPPDIPPAIAAHKWRRRPPTGIAGAVFWLAVWFGLLWLFRQVPGAGSTLLGWMQILVGLSLVALAIPLAWRLIRTRLLWSLRSKLILTYLLIGLAPVVLFVTLAAIFAYLAAGQFSIHLADTRIQSELDQIQSDNAGLVARIVPIFTIQSTADVASRTKILTETESAAASASRGPYQRRRIEAFVEGVPFALPESVPRPRLPLGLPPWANERRGRPFRSLVLDAGDLYLVSIAQQRLADGRVFSLVSSLPVETTFMETVARGLGHVRVLAQKTRESRGNSPTRYTAVSGGDEPTPNNVADLRVRFFSTIAITDWETGLRDNIPIEVHSRPSLLYRHLFGSSLGGIVTSYYRDGLVALCIVFALIESLALWMALRLSRAINASVTELYQATQRVDRGDLKVRIAAPPSSTGPDQLGELALSFNTMTASLARLLVEQKEKERLQSELTIAQEVQANLFPHHATDLPTLELHGICRPARSVSGDYYDFLVFHHPITKVPYSSQPQCDQWASTQAGTEAGVSIVLGDISGKGISAALLMATLHSAVRAYRFASEDLVYSGTPALGTSAAGPEFAAGGKLFESPGRIMALLNRHLFRSTQPEKYATLFLAHYDAATAQLTYSNAGHLPPLVLGRDGRIRRLDCGGTVVGLMDGMHYEEGRIPMRPGDLLVAYSDGVTEPENDFGDFGEDRLLDVVTRYRDHPLHIISAQVMLALDAWIGAEEQPDDITLVLARQR